MQSPAPEGHVLVNISQSSPLFEHLGPRILGDTSPKLLDAKAATN